MSVDTKYVSKSFLFLSKGIVARPIIDRAPEGTYLSLLNAYEREEAALSSRYGSSILNRDAISANFLSPSQINTIARLKALNNQIWRYYQSGNQLFRHAGNTIGLYNLIYTGLSGSAFTSVVSPTFASGTPYLFIADSTVMLKDIGTGSPTRWGILPPTQVAYAIQYSPVVNQIDNFLVNTGYTSSGMGSLTRTVFATVNGISGQSILSGNYETYSCVDASVKLAFAGMLGVDQAAGSFLRQIFNVQQDTSAFSINPMGNAITSSTSFKFGSVNGSVAASSTGLIGKTVALNFANADPNDLFVLAILVTNPAAVQEIRLQFDINNGNYTQAYYYKSIAPPSYQSGVSSPQSTAPSQAVNQEVFSRAAGVTNLSQINSAAIPIIPIDDPSIGQLQPSAMTSGSSSWTVIYIPKGMFLPVGNAGKPGLDWSNISGWQVQVITNSQGSTGVSINALYLQNGGGLSSYGGLGYDYRYIYVNAATLTPSNPSSIQYFATTPTNPAGTSTLIPLRQAINVTGQYSSDPQVTHVWVYRRGGVLNQNWQFVDKFPNITGSGAWTYKDIIADSTITQSPLLGLANDAPVTSSLQSPIATTLSAPLTPVAPFSPITVTTAQAATYVPGQIVNIGNPANLEQVYVVVGGIGSFTACVQLAHASGEQVNVYSLPAVPCYLAALAYNQMWVAGDPNNPHFLYYSNPGYPENFGPQNYVVVSSPRDPIMAVINFRGALYVATLTTWYLINPGAKPYATPTGSKHGIVAPFGWCQTESAIYYRAIDGIREFTGADGPYRTLDVEWIFQQGGNAQIQALSPVPFASLTNPSTDQMAFWNNQVFLTYLGQDGLYHRLIWHTQYRRWRDASPDPTKYILGPALYLEEDLNLLLYSEAVTGQSPAWAVAQAEINDYDDGGWAGGLLIQNPIQIAPQTPYYDQNAPNNQKQYNVLTIDANTANQILTVFLLFDDGATTLNLGTIRSAARQKFQLLINAGLGQQAYRVSLKITGAVTSAPIIYQADIHYALLAEQRSSYDSYWIKFGYDESDLTKQAYLDYTSSAPVSCSLYADGSATPYYTFTLVANPNRLSVPERVRFPARKARQTRLVMTVPAGQTMQLWQDVQVDHKALLPAGAKGYVRGVLMST